MKVKLKNATIWTFDENNTIINNGIIIIENDKIIYVGDKNIDICDKEIDCHGNILMPGLINGYVKIGDYFIENHIEDLEDLEQSILLQQQKQSPVEVKHKAQKLAKQMIQNGVTTIFDYSGYAKECKEAYQNAGIRNWIGFGIFDKGQVTSLDALKKQSLWLQGKLTKPFLYSVDTYALTDEQLLPMVQLLKEQDIAIHFPIHRSLLDIGQSIKEVECSPVAFLDNLGILQFPHELIYGTNMDKEDMDFLKCNQSSLTICPQEDMLFGYGITPIMAYLSKHIPLCLGTGYATFGDAMVDELKTVKMLCNTHSHNPNAISTMELLSMCTKNYQQYHIGVLQKGFFADILLLDKNIDMQDDQWLFHIQDYIVWTMIDGNIVYHNQERE